MAQHHPLGDIEYLRENLLNSYKLGFPIIKELVQNAEDASASSLDYGWIKGIPNAQHPLLRTPALFMLDNGNFTEENAKSIRYILGGSSKPNQQDSIGKFGLGLKSIFHLCEAFFYIAPDAQNSNYRRWDIFNPWAGAENKDDYHQDWDIRSESDKNSIKNTLSSILSLQDYQEKWFILWIPLRQSSHKTITDNEDGISLGWIKNGSDDFFEHIPDFFRNEETQKQLILLMSLLRTVNKIRYWENNLTNHKFSITLEVGAKRRSVMSQLTVNTNYCLEGIIKCDDNSIGNIEFTGSEMISNLPKFSELKSENDFPGKFREIRPHNALVFSRLNSGELENHLTLRTAVFLPIGKDEIIKCQSQYSYYLTLHGYFFVDFARTGIMGWGASNSSINKEQVEGDDSTSLLKKSWNFELFNVLLSRLLDNFQGFVDQYRLTDEEIQRICQALYKSRLYQTNRQKICESKQWIYCLTPQGNEWKLVDKRIKILSLPNKPNWDLFSHLKDLIGNSYCLTSNQAKNLRYQAETSDEWGEEELIEFLDNLTIKEVFGDSDAIDYVVLFLSKNYIYTTKRSSKIEQTLIIIIRKVLVNFQFNFNQGQIKAIKELIKFIEQQKIIYLDCQSNNILKELYNNQEIQVLLLPKIFKDEAFNNNFKLEYQDSLSILSTIEKWISNENLLNVTLSLIKQILKFSQNNLESLLTKNPSLRCLPVRAYYDEKLEFYSYNQLEIFKNEARLFQSKNNYLKALVKAIKNLEPFIVEKDIGILLQKVPAIDPVNCDIHTCKSIISKTPTLAEPNERTQLLTELLKILKEVD